MVTVPLLVEFAGETSLYQELDLVSDLPMVRNGPPGTFVLFPNGLRVSLPTDQIVSIDESGGRARVGFAGMRFDGLDGDRSIFVRPVSYFCLDDEGADRGSWA